MAIKKSVVKLFLSLIIPSAIVAAVDLSFVQEMLIKPILDLRDSGIFAEPLVNRLSLYSPVRTQQDAVDIPDTIDYSISFVPVEHAQRIVDLGNSSRFVGPFANRLSLLAAPSSDDCVLVSGSGKSCPFTVQVVARAVPEDMIVSFAEEGGNILEKIEPCTIPKGGNVCTLYAIAKPGLREESVASIYMMKQYKDSQNLTKDFVVKAQPTLSVTTSNKTIDSNSKKEVQLTVTLPAKAASEVRVSFAQKVQEGIDYEGFQHIEPCTIKVGEKECKTTALTQAWEWEKNENAKDSADIVITAEANDRYFENSVTVTVNRAAKLLIKPGNGSTITEGDIPLANDDNSQQETASEPDAKIEK